MHKHKFKITGHGCMVVGSSKNPCDITYECECKEKFSLQTSVSGHKFLPNQFETQTASEPRKRANEDIDSTLLGEDIIN